MCEHGFCMYLYSTEYTVQLRKILHDIVKVGSLTVPKGINSTEKMLTFIFSSYYVSLGS
jgi:hypothetical protein